MYKQLDLYTSEDEYVTSIQVSVLPLSTIMGIYTGTLGFRNKKKDILYAKLMVRKDGLKAHSLESLVGPDGLVITEQELKIIKLKKLMGLND